MAKPNYQFDKRQRDIAKKKKQEEKLAKKKARNEAGQPDSDTDEEPEGAVAPGDPT